MSSRRPTVLYRSISSASEDREKGGDYLNNDHSKLEKAQPGKALLYVFMSSLSSFCFGYHLSVVNGPLETIAAYFTGVSGNLFAQGLVVSTLLMGATVGATVAGKLADMLGRKKSLLICGLVLSLGPVTCTIFPSFLPELGSVRFVCLLLGRMITGFGVGIASSVCPLYISEVSPRRLRGSYCSVNQIVICFGIVLGLLTNLVYAMEQWRTMFLWGLVPALSLSALSYSFLPESPRWLASNNLKGKAEQTCLQLWGNSTQALEEAKQVLEEGTVLAGAAATDSSLGMGEKARTESIFDSKYRKVLVMCVMMFVFQQMSGVNSIIFFSSNIFKQIGIESTALASLVVGIVNFSGTLVACYLVEKMGRKQLMEISYGCMSLFLTTLAIATKFSQSAPWMPMVILSSVILYVLGFSLGAGAIPGLYVNEIAPSSVRGAASSVAFTTHWIMNILIGQTFLQLANSLGISTMYFVFALWCMGALVFVHFKAVETKNKSLQEVAKMLVSS
jgi:sugar porter (SP) family MFS transporter